MTKKEFLFLLDEMLELAPGTLSGEENLQFFTNWDSLAVLMFISLVEKHFNIILNPSDINKAKTINELILLIKQIN